jgi:hypothetical protein
MFILNDFAKSDPAIQKALAGYAQQIEKEYETSRKIREGLITPQPTSDLYISDRD